MEVVLFSQNTVLKQAVPIRSSHARLAFHIGIALALHDMHGQSFTGGRMGSYSANLHATESAHQSCDMVCRSPIIVVYNVTTLTPL